YAYDAIRTPWRFAMDAAWFGDERAVKYLTMVNTFFKKVGISNISDKYTLDGTPVKHPEYSGHNAAAVSMAAISAMVDPDGAYRQAFWNEMTVNVKDEYVYYNESLRSLSMLFTGDLMDKPVVAPLVKINPMLAPNQSTAQQHLETLFSRFFNTYICD